jgi:hypothetical protein
LVVLAIWLGTIAFPFSTLFFSHQLTAALLALAFCLIFQLRQGITLPGRAYAAAGAAGFLIGFSVTTEYPTAILAGLLSLYFLWTAFFQWKVPPKRKAMIIAFWILGGAIGGGALIAYNLAAFGKPFYLAYEALARSDSPFPMHSHGWVGMQWPGGKQFVHAVAAFMIFPPVGLLYIVVRGGWVYACNPVLWLALPGLVIMLWKKEWRAEGVLITAMTAAYILFLSCYGTSIYDWAGASYLGPRHIIPLLPFLALPLYFGAVRLRFIFYPLCALSVFYMLIATAIEPRSPTPFEIPARDFFLPDYLRGRLAQNPQSLFFWNRTLTKNSNAFNLAKVAGIPGRAQLAPLMVWWLLVGGAILLVAAQADAESEEARPATGAGDGTARRRRFRSSPRVAIAFLFLFAGGVSLAPAIHHAMLAPPNSNRGLAGKYYRNDHWAGAPEEIQIDPNINFDWSKSWPLPSPFSIEWTGQLIASLPGDYTFSLIADDGALVEIDGRIVVDVTKGPLLQEKNGTINLSAGLHRIRVRYFNTLFGGSVKLSWSLTGRPKEVVPTEALVPEGAPLPKGR